MLVPPGSCPLLACVRSCMHGAGPESPAYRNACLVFSTNYARSLFLLCCMALALLSCVVSHNALGNVVRVTLDRTGSYVLSQ